MSEAMLPKGWEVLSIFDIARPKQWKTIPVKDLSETGYKIYGANGVIGFYSMYTHQDPTVMITCRGATCGNIHVSEPMSYINGNAMALDNLSKNINIKFLSYFLKGYDFKNIISGSAQPQITQEGMQALYVNVAPLNEQTRIANKLDELLAQVDTIKARVDAIPNILKRFRQSVLAAAVSGKLTEEWRGENISTFSLAELIEAKDALIKQKFVKKDLEVETCEIEFETPNSWCGIKLKSVATKVTDGEHKTPIREEAGHYLLSARNVRDDFIDLSNVDYVGDDEFKKLRKRCDPNKGDVLISCSGSVGRISLVDKSDCYVMVRSAALVKTIESCVDNRYLMFVLRSPQLQKIIESAAKSTAQANLFLGPIKELAIPFTSIEEQKEIVQRVDQLFAFADQIEQRIKDAQSRINNLTQSILAKAFRGELVPQAPNDEPASVLLERIQKEREVAEKLSKAAKKTVKKKVKA